MRAMAAAQAARKGRKPEDSEARIDTISNSQPLSAEQKDTQRNGIPTKKVYRRGQAELEAVRQTVSLEYRGCPG